MLGRLLGRWAVEVELCDESASVCDARRAADRRLDEARTRALSARTGSW
jgi:hypothetical protein